MLFNSYSVINKTVMHPHVSIIIVLLVVIGYHYLVVFQSFYTKFTHMCPVLLFYCLLFCVSIIPYKVLPHVPIIIVLVVFGWHLICIVFVLCFNHSTHMYPIISYKFHLIWSHFIRVSPPPCVQFNYFISYSPNFTMRFRRC